MPGGVRSRLESVRRRIEAACERAGRDPAEVTLVGACKAQPPERLAEAVAAGLAVLGENRVQEAEAHREALAVSCPGAAVAWHLIGPLQSNKARRAIGLFDAVHSIDRLKIARALDAELARPASAAAAEAGERRRLPVFVEVNLAGEPSKHGFSPAGLTAAAAALSRLEHLEVVGLMAVPPPAADPEAARPWFRRLAELAGELASQPGWGGFSRRLSMGMSDDFEVAVEEGATHVRVGSALFGPRD